MIQAEEFGITAANVEQVKAESKNPTFSASWA